MALRRGGAIGTHGSATLRRRETVMDIDKIA
jgi:hypothetical protein